MKIFLPTTFLFALLFISFNVKAQYIHDYQGKGYNEQSYNDVEGNPYLTTGWFGGIVNFNNGKSASAKLKYDLVKDELLFQNTKDSSAMVFIDPVKSFRFETFKIDETNLVPIVFSNGYPAVDDQTTASFYQVIADGKLKLLKHYKKSIRTDQAFNSASATKTFVLVSFYYLLSDAKITRIKPNQKVVLAAMNDKADKIQVYLKSTKVDYKSDADLFKLFNYYNSL